MGLIPQQTPQQLANALNPTPVNVTTPANQGLFRTTGDQGNAIYKQDSAGNLTRYDLSSLGQGGSYGAQFGQQIGGLKSQYGIDWNSLQEINLGDLYSQMAKKGLGYNDVNGSYHAPTANGSLSDLLQSSPQLTTASTAINNTPNTLATPTQLAASGAAQTQQLAGVQGKNVTTQTDANGNILGSQATPIASGAIPMGNGTPGGYIASPATSTGNGKTTTVVSYKDNPNGTTTVQYADGTSEIGTYSKNADGTYNFNASQPTAPGATLEELKQQLLGAQDYLTSRGAPPAYTAPSSISSSSLTGGTTQNYQQGPTLPGYSATAGLDTSTPQLTATPQEQKQTTLADQIAQLNTQESGKATYQDQQNVQQDIAGKTALVNDFSSQLKIAQLEAANIQQQTQTGEGVTTAIDQRQRAEALRLNNVKSLGIYAQLQMAQGNLSTAQAAADKAVSLKYDPIEAQLAAAKSNLDLIKNDPLTTLQDKNRALTAQTKLDAQTAAIAKQKNDATKIWDIYFNAATNGLTDVTKLNAIKNAQTPEAALQIAGTLGAKGTTAQPTASIQEYQFAVQQGYTGTFSQYQNEDANRKAKIAGATNGLSNADRTAFDSIVSKYNQSPLILAADRLTVLQNSISQIRANPGDAAQQLNLAYSYVQALDTYQSAVREGELGLVNSIDSKIGQLGNSIQQIRNGQLVRPEVALQIASAADTISNTIKQGATAKAASFKSQANAVGLGSTWDAYVGGFTPSYSSGGGGGVTNANPLGI